MVHSSGAAPPPVRGVPPSYTSASSALVLVGDSGRRPRSTSWPISRASWPCTVYWAPSCTSMAQRIKSIRRPSQLARSCATCAHGGCSAAGHHYRCGGELYSTHWSVRRRSSRSYSHFAEIRLRVRTGRSRGHTGTTCSLWPCFGSVSLSLRPFRTAVPWSRCCRSSRAAWRSSSCFGVCSPRHTTFASSSNGFVEASRSSTSGWDAVPMHSVAL
mmetsp:Transcript_9276/g.21929  ORF Transcript_9276/g.21929 Transcript_9276/m.21929 type:complete len:215 (-) Transcript_9276:1307-1951(-)